MDFRPVFLGDAGEEVFATGTSGVGRSEVRGLGGGGADKERDWVKGFMLDDNGILMVLGIYDAHVVS